MTSGSATATPQFGSAFATMDNNSIPPQPPQADRYQPSRPARIEAAQHQAPHEHPYYLESVPRRADVLTSANHSIPTRPQSAITRSSKYYKYGHERYPDRRTSHVTSTYSSPARTDSGVHSLAPASPHGAPSESHGSPPDSIVGEDERLQQYGDRLSRIVTPDRRSSPSGPASASATPYVRSAYDVSIASSDEDEGQSKHQTIRSLLHLALTAWPLSLAFCLYTILSLCLAAILAPLGLCIKGWPSLPIRLLHLLMPPLNFQRRCIYQPQLIPPRSRSSSSSRTPLSSAESIPDVSTYSSDISSASLITTHLLAPIVALPLATCAWVMGTAWGLGAMVSDEEAGDDLDERRIAERVVSWWAWWLDRGMKIEDVEAIDADRYRKQPEMVQRRA